ncbi:hypothetical protein Emed_001167 [Eimeria media]
MAASNKISQVSKSKDSQKTETARDRDTDGKANWMYSVRVSVQLRLGKGLWSKDSFASQSSRRLMIRLHCGHLSLRLTKPAGCSTAGGSAPSLPSVNALTLAKRNFLMLSAEQRPQADLARSLPFTAAAEGPPEALGSLTFQRPFLHKGTPAARGMLLLLVYSVAVAAAFLVALCFRRLHSKRREAPHEGSQKRLLAGQQHPWGPQGGPQQGDDDDEEAGFLSNTLEACLDMQDEMNLPSLPSQLVPPSESQAVREIMWKLEDEALLFEIEKSVAQQPTQYFPQTPAAEPTYSGPINSYEGGQWLGPQASMWEEGEASSLEALLYPPTPSYQTPYDAAEPFHPGSLPHELPRVSSAASAAAAAPAAASLAWHQHVGGLQEAGGLQGVEGPQLVGGPQGVEGPQEVEGPQGLAAPAGAPTPPSPSSASDLLSLLQQQPEQQQPSSSQEAAASEESGALSVSSAAEEAGSQSRPSKEPKKADGGAKRKSSVQEPPRKKPRVWLIHSYEKPPPKAGRQPIKKKVTAALRTYNEVSASGDVVPSTSGVSAPGQPASREATTSKQTGTDAPQAQPSGPQVGDGVLTVKLHTGETISFAHPPLPTPPNAPPHYRLPRVRPEVIQRHFSISKGLVSGIVGNIWSHLDIIRRLFLKPELSTEDVDVLVVRTQSLVRHMMTRYQSPITNVDPTGAKEKLALRFVCFEAVVITIQLLGPAMHPDEWFPQLVAAIHTDYQDTTPITSPTAFLNIRLRALLVEGLKQLKRGLRPSLELTTEVKKLLFSSDVAPRNIPPRDREIWRQAVDPGAEEEESEEETSSAED